MHPDEIPPRALKVALLSPESQTERRGRGRSRAIVFVDVTQQAGQFVTEMVEDFVRAHDPDEGEHIVILREPSGHYWEYRVSVRRPAPLVKVI